MRSVVLSGGGMWNLLLAGNVMDDSGGLFVSPQQRENLSGPLGAYTAIIQNYAKIKEGSLLA